MAQAIKKLLQCRRQEDPLEKGMATHSCILAWRIPRTEESGGLQSMGLQRIGHDWVTSTLHMLRNVMRHLFLNLCNVCSWSTTEKKLSEQESTVWTSVAARRLTMGDRGVSRLVSVLLSSASLSLSLPLSLTKQICRFIPLCRLGRSTQNTHSTQLFVTRQHPKTVVLLEKVV